MHLEGMLHKLFGKVMHQKRLETLGHIIKGVFKAKNLSLTELGRSLALPVQERSCIRRVDRFLDNEHLEKEREFIYQVVSSWLVGKKERVAIVVDWSKISHGEYCLLRASLVHEGRSLTLYEEVHHQRKEGQHNVHKGFLKKLKQLLPESCKPIIITDAGFHNPWFSEVLQHGWDYLGRIRNNKLYRLEDSEKWHSIQRLLKQASSIPMSLGKGWLAKTNALETYFYLFRETLKGRHATTKQGKKREGRKHRVYAKSAKEPLLLVSSLKGNKRMAKKMVTFYKKRMQIEESFRDMKSKSSGFGLRAIKTKSASRLKIYLLINLLATFWAWLVGYTVERKQLHRQFQANSIKNKRVLSFFYLGCRAIKRNMIILYEDLWAALQNVQERAYA